MTTCGCCECIAAVLPSCNGIMTVNRDYTGMTPCGMKFTTLAGVMGGGAVFPGFRGPLQVQHHPGQVPRRRRRPQTAWSGCPRSSRRRSRDRLIKRGEEIGMPDLVDRIADETVGTTEEEILAFLKEKDHPALSMESDRRMMPEGTGSIGGSARPAVETLCHNRHRKYHKGETMGLTGIQIFKMLPKTNCGECGVPTCLAFAMNLAAGKAELVDCPYVSEEAKATLWPRPRLPRSAPSPSAPATRAFSRAARPSCSGTKRPFTIRPVSRPWSPAIWPRQRVDQAQEWNAFQYERVGLNLRPELVAVKDVNGNAAAFRQARPRRCRDQPSSA